MRRAVRRHSTPTSPQAIVFDSMRRYRTAQATILFRMIVDVAAEVIVNTRLSTDYNVVSFSAPGIAAAAAPGQFIMIKPGAALDPLLRRPFEGRPVP